jgi:cation diffusion facilitator family transporter
MHNRLGASAQQAALRVTHLSIVINLVMSVGKVTVGYLGSSRALIADGLHSLVDLSSDVAVLFGLYVAHLPKDAEHPYGHHRFATMVQVVIAASIIGFAGWIAYASIKAFMVPPDSTPSGWVLIVAFLSIVAKEVLFWLTRSVAIRLKSRLLLINAWHHRTDTISSIVTLVAVAIPWLAGEKFWFLDPLVGAALGGYLAFVGIRLMIPAVNDLLDRAPEDEVINDLREHVLPIDGTVAYHHFRARRIGDMFEVDMHLQVSAHCTVEEGHEIARAVRINIMNTHPEVLDVLIHIEPATNEHLQDKGISDRRISLQNPHSDKKTTK